MRRDSYIVGITGLKNHRDLFKEINNKLKNINKISVFTTDKSDKDKHYKSIKSDNFKQYEFFEKSKVNNKQFGILKSDVYEAIEKHDYSLVYLDEINSKDLRRKISKHIYNIYVDVNHKNIDKNLKNKKSFFDLKNFDCYLKINNKKDSVANEILNFLTAMKYTNELKKGDKA